jgi:beta-lactamase regulating signal transducer with metallopeptidase domain
MTEQSGSVLALLLGSAIKGTVVLLAAYGCAAALRRASAATRHLVWTAAIAALVGLPVLAVALPVWRVATAGAPQTVTVAPVPAQAASAAAHPVEAPTRPARVDWPAWLVLAWAAGMIAVLSRMLAGTARVWWVARHSGPVEDAEWNALLAELTASLGLRRRVRLVVCERAAMPMTWGASRPLILLPRSAKEWTAEKRRLVLAHELIHVVRLDHWS